MKLSTTATTTATTTTMTTTTTTTIPHHLLILTILIILTLTTTALAAPTTSTNVSLALTNATENAADSFQFWVYKCLAAPEKTLENCGTTESGETVYLETKDCPNLCSCKWDAHQAYTETVCKNHNCCFSSFVKLDCMSGGQCGCLWNQRGLKERGRVEGWVEGKGIGNETTVEGEGEGIGIETTTMEMEESGGGNMNVADIFGPPVITKRCPVRSRA